MFIALISAAYLLQRNNVNSASGLNHETRDQLLKAFTETKDMASEHAFLSVQMDDFYGRSDLAVVFRILIGFLRQSVMMCACPHHAYSVIIELMLKSNNL